MLQHPPYLKNFLYKFSDLSGIRICRIARIQAKGFFIRAIRKIRIQKAFSSY